ncbi:hypothetical protein [uncultured Pontibacter sp.]|nr:hypothetical protein [uncultured Pontibacter sp.]
MPNNTPENNQLTGPGTSLKAVSTEFKNNSGMKISQRVLRVNLL